MAENWLQNGQKSAKITKNWREITKNNNYQNWPKIGYKMAKNHKKSAKIGQKLEKTNHNN